MIFTDFKDQQTGLIRIRDVEVLRAGRHVSSSGRPVDITSKDISHISEVYDPAFHEAPVVIGHPKEDDPAYGWVRALRASGETLLADIDVQPELYAALKRELWKKRSSRLVYEDLGGQGFYLKHLGFLGAVPPAIKGLADIKLSDGDGRESIICFVEEKSMGWKDLFKKKVDELPEDMPALVLQVGGQTPPERPDARFSESDLNRRVEDAQKRAREEERKKVEVEFAEKEKQREEEQKRARHKTDCKARLDALMKDGGRVTPAMMKAGLLEFAESLRYQEDGKLDFGEASLTPYDWLTKVFLPALPKQVEFGEVAARSSDAGAGEKDAANRLDELTRKRMDERKVGYDVAFSEVQMENPELVKEYMESMRRPTDGR